jgi:RNA polymerase sigma-70 factor (ECF subfamily)
MNDADLGFERHRARLFGVAYRMLGSVGDAEDVVQDAFLRWRGVDREAVENPEAYLVRLVARLCLDVLKSARSRREQYVGLWLPEPLVAGAGTPRPDELAALADDLSFAFLMLLERLNPVERAVFLLRQSFEMSYAEIAPVVGRSEEACRQADTRARKRIAAGERRRAAEPDEHDRLLGEFLAAARSGDIQGLVGRLAEDAVAYSDGGGRVAAATRPVRGADKVARFVAGLTAKAKGLEVRLARVNGRTGVVGTAGGEVRSVVTFTIAEGRIREIFFQVNPAKLQAVPLV